MKAPDCLIDGCRSEKTYATYKMAEAKLFKAVEDFKLPVRTFYVIAARPQEDGSMRYAPVIITKDEVVMHHFVFNSGFSVIM